MHTDYPETPDIETSSDDYATRFAGEVGTWFLKLQEDITLDMLKPYVGATVLDVGGGHGQVTDALVANQYNLTVLGSVPVCVERIQHHVDKGDVQFQTGNVLKLPYDDNAFDVVLSYRLIAHITDWHTLLAEFARVARKAVIMDYAELNSVNLISSYLFSMKKSLEGNTRPFELHKLGDLRAQFQEHHFKVDAVRKQFFFPMVLHRKLKSVPISSLLEGTSRQIGLTRAFGSPVIIRAIPLR